MMIPEESFLASMTSSTRSGSRENVSSSMSANSGSMPDRTIAFGVAAYVSGEVTAPSNRSPPLSLALLMAVSPAISAEVPELSAMQCFVPTNAKKAFSNARVSRPSETRPESRTLSTAPLMSWSTSK